MAQGGKHSAIVVIYILVILGAFGLAKAVFANTPSNPGFENPRLPNNAISLSIMS